MIKNYLTTAIRNILRNKVHSSINLLSLSVGLACVILIALFLRHEWSYDAFHENKDTIYRIAQVTKNLSGEKNYAAQGPLPLGPALEDEYPEIIRNVRYASRFFIVVRYADKIFYERILFTDPSLFEMFTFPLVQGDPGSVLEDPNSVVITEDVAVRYFGQDDPLGKRLIIEIEGAPEDFFVTGVARKPPSNSTIQFDLVIRMEKRRTDDSWGSGIVQTYVQLADHADPRSLESKLLGFAQKYYGDIIEMRRSFEGPFAERFALSQDEDAMTFRLQPLREVYLHVPWREGAMPRGKPAHSFILTGIAGLILIIACINFMTLTIGRSVSRAREVGMRKVMGANRLRLMTQFWGEALVMVFMAAVLGLILARLFLPTFNLLTDRTLVMHNYLSLPTLAAFIGLLVMVGLIAGSYPAVVLSGFQPVDSLRGEIKGKGKGLLTRLLVTAQYAISIFFICCTIIMLWQLHYIRRSDTGFDRDNVVVLPIRTSVYASKNIEEAKRLSALLKTELAREPGISGVTAATSPATRGGMSMGWETPNGVERRASPQKVDPDFFQVLGLELVEGRFFNEQSGSDPDGAVVVNETLVRQFGLEYPVAGRTQEGLLGKDTNPTVIGVIKDYHFRSLHHEVDPLILHMDPKMPASRGNILIKISPFDIEGTLSTIENTWKRFNPDTPFEYSFLDEDLENLYGNEARWGNIVSSASILAILISSMGLFGLASLAVTLRTKEIGIRKVLGASVRQVVGLLCKEFIFLMLIANIIAWPVAWYAMNRWLQNFAYRIDLSWWIFMLAGVLALAIALLTVSWQAIRAATANPVDALRYQ